MTIPEGVTLATAAFPQEPLGTTSFRTSPQFDDVATVFWPLADGSPVPLLSPNSLTWLVVSHSNGMPYSYGYMPIVIFTEMWQQAPREYLRERLAKFTSTLQPTFNGELPDVDCLVSTNKARSNGDAQLKLRWLDEETNTFKQAAPRPWRVHFFLKGEDIPRGHNCSHLCGRGLQGCANPDHIVIEPHSVNLDRKLCTTWTKCPCPCNILHPVKQCTHDPPCLQ